MKTKRFMRSFIKIAITAFLVLLTGNALAIDNRSRVVSPYWQVDTGSYTFIAVSHSSLSGMNSQIGLKVTAIDSTGTSYGTAAEFTVNSGGTQRIFIVPTSHTTINPTSLTDSDVTFIRGTTDYSYGSILVDPVASHPSAVFLQRDYTRTVPWPNYHGEGMRDITTLAYWGSIIVEANTTGFAMEFIGDMNDSASAVDQTGSCTSAVTGANGATSKRVCPSIGVNLQ